MSEADSLDPRVIDTIIAEAGNDVAGQRAVAAAIINRAKAQGKTPLQIVQQSGQFEGYSNPGSASVKAQQIASVRQNATKAFNDVLTGAVADPLKGGKDFRSDAAANGLHAPHGTVSIGGNTFALGNAPSSAVAAIDAVAPVPRSIPTSLSAYADTPAVALPPLPIPRPSNPEGIRSVEINPDGSLKQSLTDALAARFGNSTARTGADTSIYDTVSGYTPAFQSPSPLAPFVSEDHPTSNAVSAPLTSRSVQSIRISPGDPLMGYAPSLQDALTAKAAQMAQQRPIPPSLGANGTAGVGASRNALVPSFVPQQNSGAIKTLGQAGQVALPQGVVPASVTRDLASIAAQQMNRSGSPDDRQSFVPQIAPTQSGIPDLGNNVVYDKNGWRTVPTTGGQVWDYLNHQDVIPTPMPGRPAALSAKSPILPSDPRNANDTVRSVPYVPPSQPNQNYTDASNPLDINRLGLTVGPPVPRTTPAVQAINQAASKPTTAYTYKQMQVSNPAYEKYISAQGADDIGAGPGSFASLQSSLVPPKTIPKTVAVPHVPVPSPTLRPLTSFNTVNPMSQIVPNVQSGLRSTPIGHIGSFLMGEPVQGGLLSLLNGNNPLSGLGGLFGSGNGKTVVAPVGGNPAITYGTIVPAGQFAAGSPNASFEKQNGMGSVTNSMAASSRWNGGY